jgi:hypothetical protein
MNYYPLFKVSTQQIEEWCQLRTGIEYVETSAKTGNNIERGFQLAADKASKYSQIHSNMFDDADMMPCYNNLSITSITKAKVHKKKCC